MSEVLEALFGLIFLFFVIVAAIKLTLIILAWSWWLILGVWSEEV